MSAWISSCDRVSWYYKQNVKHRVANNVVATHWMIGVLPSNMSDQAWRSVDIDPSFSLSLVPLNSVYKFQFLWCTKPCSKAL